MVQHQTFSWGDLVSKPPFLNLGNLVYPTLPVSFGRDTKSCWSLLPVVYAREVKDPTQGVNV